MQIKSNPNLIYVVSSHQLNVTSILPDNKEIFVFTGPSIPLLKHILEQKELTIDSAIASNLVGSQLSDEDITPFLDFCLDKKIFTAC